MAHRLTCSQNTHTYKIINNNLKNEKKRALDKIIVTQLFLSYPQHLDLLRRRKASSHMELRKVCCLPGSDLSHTIEEKDKVVRQRGKRHKGMRGGRTKKDFSCFPFWKWDLWTAVRTKGPVWHEENVPMTDRQMLLSFIHTELSSDNLAIDCHTLPDKASGKDCGPVLLQP